MKAPKLWRKKKGRGGKYTGNYFVTIKGTDVNLKTQDADEATKRLPEAIRGRRNFPDHLDEAAAAVDGPPPPPEVPPPVAAVALPPPAAASSAPADQPPRPPVQPDAVLPPLLPPMSSGDNNSAAAEAEATNAAAAAGSEDDGGADAGAGDAWIPFGSEALDGMIENGAMLLVDLQLQLQAAVIRRRLKKEPGTIPEESPVRKMAADAWKEQLRRWLPSTADLLPPWALALAIPALCIPVQVMTATELPKENGPQEPAAAAA